MLAILAVFALTKLIALQTSTKALTIFFYAFGFFAGTLSRGLVGWYSFEGARMSIVCKHFSLIDIIFMSRLIPTATTRTTISA